MQENKVKNQIHDARKSALKEVIHEHIKPHGKLWGMDVFSWKNPSFEMIESTAKSFPFPVILISSVEWFDFLQNQCREICNKLHGVVIYNQASTEKRDMHFSSGNFKEIFQQINRWKLEKGVVLFCCEGIDADYYHQQFVEYLNLYQY